MKHAFLPPSSLFYVSLIASLYPSLSFRFEILENLKLTKEGISKARAWAAPGLSAKETQHLGCFAAIPAKNLSSSLNGSHFLPEEAEPLYRRPGAEVFLQHPRPPTLQLGWAHLGRHHQSFLTSPAVPQLCLARRSGQERNQELPFPNFPLLEPVLAMTAPCYLGSTLFIQLFVQVTDISCAGPSCCP